MHIIYKKIEAIFNDDYVNKADIKQAINTIEFALKQEKLKISQ